MSLLLFDNGAQVHVFVELVGFGTGVGDEAFLVEGFGDFHDCFGIDS